MTEHFTLVLLYAFIAVVLVASLIWMALANFYVVSPGPGARGLAVLAAAMSLVVFLAGAANGGLHLEMIGAAEFAWALVTVCFVGLSAA